MTELTICPECGCAAEVIDRYVLESTHGPVEHRRIHCVQGRFYTLIGD